MDTTWKFVAICQHSEPGQEYYTGRDYLSSLHSIFGKSKWRIQETKTLKEIGRLTDKGEDLHQSNKAAYLSKLQKLWTNIEALISDIENQTTLESLRVLNDKLNSIYVKYTATSQEYTNFLVRTKTNESQKEAEYLMDVIKSHNMVIDSALKQIFTKTKTFTLQSKASSHRSGRSSANSKRSSILVQKRAELEASKTKLKFAEEEAKIHKQKAMIEEQQELSNAKVSRQKAELQVDLNMLVQKKETEAAKVELEVYEAEEEVRSGLALTYRKRGFSHTYSKTVS
ncbi:Hypothetical predicted protein [Mytilus galloprovincialis]|uniref:Uncharacterized protein n=1 Tax=Mytilus galloprovincialis TaxID=29158 RepID=A0A8B6ET06_MYTGA|nr:Hypothetical predicted protein [Mytilus galloprovincialis]